MDGKTQTIKRSKSVFVIGAITLGIIALLAVYFVLIATGVISATPTRITLSSMSSVTEYSGKAYTDERWVLEDGELKEGHKITVTFSGSRTEVGESQNTFIAEITDANGYDVTSSYAITYKPGTLSVVPRKIVVASASAEKNYDGTPLTYNSCALVDGTLVAGHELKFSVNGTLTAAGRTDNTFVATVTDGNRDVSADYDIEYLYGTLYVHGEILNIATGSANKIYDGEPLVSDNWLLVSGKLLSADHKPEVTVVGKQTEVGEAENLATCRIVDGDGNDVTSMYEVVFSFGTLTVKPITIFVETRSAYKIYDGTPLTADGWRVSTDGAIASDVWYASGRTVTVGEYSVTATVVGSQTDAGVSDNTAVFVTVTRDGAPADGVAVECTCGELVVDKRNLTVQSGTAGKAFDGTPLTCDEWEIVSMTQPAEGHTVNVRVSGTNTYVGTADNVIAEVIVYDGDGNDVSRNYNITTYFGTLSVFGDNSGGNGGNGGEGDGSGNNQAGNGENDENGGDGSGGQPGPGDLADDGTISGGSMTDPEEGADVVVMQLFSSGAGSVYLKQKSFGDYDFNNWRAASAYSDTVHKQSVFGGPVDYGMDYLTGISLGSAGMEYDRLKVRPVTINKYYLPYFLEMTELNYGVQKSDVEYTANSGLYELYYYSYDYLSDGGRKLDNADLLEYAEYERAYRNYVYDNYTAVPDSTREYMQGIVDANRLDKLGFAAQVAAVAGYIRGSATYSMKYDRALDDEPDIAVAFLDKYKEGICQHYATAATLLFRTLGIPARYTIGYVGSTVAGEWTDVTANKAHAWVEIYVDGAGWVNVEVTGGGGGYDGNGGPNQGGFGTPGTGEIIINPRDVYVKYSEWDGKPVTYMLDGLQGLSRFERDGYSYTYKVSGSQSGLGIGESRIDDFKLFDAGGKDVTDEYYFKCMPGKLHIYMCEITVTTESYSKVYDGTPLVGAGEDWWSYSGALLDGHKVSHMEMTGEIVDVGQRSNVYEIAIADGDGNDVTYMYKINSVYGMLTVTARTLTVTAGSAIGYLGDLDENGFTCDEYSILGDENGGLCEGHTALVSVSGVQYTIGRSQNVIASVVIVDGDGNNVTANYSVVNVSGTLTVLPDSLKPKGGD